MHHIVEFADLVGSSSLSVADTLIHVLRVPYAAIVVRNVCVSATDTLKSLKHAVVTDAPTDASGTPLRCIAYKSATLYVGGKPHSYETPMLHVFVAMYFMSEREQQRFKNVPQVTSMKDNFLANISHEIRTPLNGIIGMTRLLMECTMTTEQRQHLRIVHDCGFQLLDLINDILDYSKMSVGGLGLEKQSFDVRKCIESAYDVVALKAREKELDISYFINPTVPLLVLGDGKRLRQVVVNLLSNAVKFTTQGTVITRVRVKEKLTCNPGIQYQDYREGSPSARCTIFYTGALGSPPRTENAKPDIVEELSKNEPSDTSSTMPVDSNYYMLEISVTDTGSGIPQEKLQLIFEAFSQVSHIQENGFEHAGGTGLGLAICKQLTTLMHGTVEVSSVVGEGSTFTVCVPLQENPNGNSKTQLPENYVRAMTNKIALVVDDNPVNRLTCCHLLMGWGMKPFSCASGDEALMYIEATSVDIAFLDVCMPGMGGVELATRIRAKNADIPIVALSSIGDTFEDPSSSFSTRLVKPVKAQALLHVCVSLLSTDATCVVIGSVPPTVVRDVSVLVVDDFIHNQTVACTQLAKLGCRDVHVASNGLDAVKACRNRTFDLVLMDIKMPICDGYTATVHLHELFPNQRERPYIIAMTAMVLDADRRKCQEVGMDGYLSKPLSLDELEIMLDVVSEKANEDKR